MEQLLKLLPQPSKQGEASEDEYEDFAGNALCSYVGVSKRNRTRKTEPKNQKIEPKNRLTGLIFFKKLVWLTELKKFCGFGFDFGFDSAV